LKKISIISLVFAYFILQTAVIVYLYEQKNQDEEVLTKELQYRYGNTYSNIDTNLRKEIMLDFINYVQKPEVINILSLANQTKDKNKLNSLRKELYQNMLPFYNTLLRRDIKVFHFHLPEAVSFLRMHKPNKFGDTLFDLRPSLEKINKTKKFVTGYESGRLTNAFRNIIPLYNNDTYIGSVEISFSEYKLIKELERHSKAKYDLIIHKDFIWDSAKNLYSVSSVHKDFYISHKNLKNSHEQLFFPYKEIQKNLHLPLKEVDLTQFKAFTTFVQQKQNYSVNLIPFKNINSECVGYVISYKPNEKIVEIVNDFYFNLIFSSSFLILIFLFIYFQQKKSSMIKLREQFFDAIYNNLDDIVVLTQGKIISDANNAFLDFFELEKLEDFTKDYDCICDHFEVIEKNDYIYKNKGGKNWVDTVLTNQDIQYKTVIKKRDIPRTFSVSAKYMNFDQEQRSLLIFTDITELLSIQENLEYKVQEKTKELQRYIELVDKNIIISTTDKKGIINYISEAFVEISGYTREELIGANQNIIKHEDTSDEIIKELWQTITSGKTWKGEFKNRKKDGGFYWVDASIYPNFTEDGKISGYTAVRIDITNKKLIEDISVTDGLTGIFNRRHFNETFPKVINSAKRKNDLVSFLIMDIDYFKQYNDTYGHQKGDTALIKVSKKIKDSLKRADDSCYRLGGEEFGVIFKSESKEKAQQFANTIRTNIENIKILHSENTASKYLSVSMGLVCKNAEDIISEDEIYKEADDLLYKAKKSGRNKIVANI